MSSVFYRFKSRKDESRVTFDGTGISIFDLKKEIIIANGLSKANDFDLVVLDGSTEEGVPSRWFHWLPELTIASEYKDDAYIVPRSSSVVIKRVYAKPGKGRAAHYLGSAGPAGSTTEQGAKNAGGGGGRPVQLAQRQHVQTFRREGGTTED